MNIRWIKKGIEYGGIPMWDEKGLKKIKALKNILYEEIPNIEEDKVNEIIGRMADLNRYER